MSLCFTFFIVTMIHFGSSSYPSTYIDKEFRRFFHQYLSTTSISPILPLMEDEEQFLIIRRKLLAQPTAKQTQVAKSATTVRAINNEQSNAQHRVGQSETTRERPRAAMKEIQQNKDKFEKNIFIHCKHEARLEGLKRYIHEIHDSFFKNTIHGEIRLVVGNRNNPNMEYELTTKRPRASLLKGQ